MYRQVSAVCGSTSTQRLWVDMVIGHIKVDKPATVGPGRRMREKRCSSGFADTELSVEMDQTEYHSGMLREIFRELLHKRILPLT